jgi:hypothetical protein
MDYYKIRRIARLEGSSTTNQDATPYSRANRLIPDLETGILFFKGLFDL